MTERKVRCDYCQGLAALITGGELYPHLPGLRHKYFWRCNPCDAHVGCHENSKNHKALGRLANAELRRAKTAAHAAFDRLWRGKMARDNCTKNKARKAGYAWLTEQLRIEARECHIGHMDLELCRRVVAICEPFHAEYGKAA